MSVRAGRTYWGALDRVQDVFSRAECPGLFPEIPADDGRCRIVHWWFALFDEAFVYGSRTAGRDCAASP